MNSKVKTLISGVCLSASLLAAAMPQAMALEDSTPAEPIGAAQTIADYSHALYGLHQRC